MAIGSRLMRLAIVFFGLILLWQSLVWVTGVPHYILPAPTRVSDALIAKFAILLPHAMATFTEIIGGLMIGAALGIASALIMGNFRPARRWLLPVLVISQAVPIFALAPILVLWLGYGMASKIAMAVLIIYFPVTAAFYDGLRRTDHGWLDLAQVMNGSRWAVMRHVRIPAALPALASGLRVATAVSPIGAVVGEWVGSNSGLGYLMLKANAQLDVELMFAALFVLAVFAVALYFAVDVLLRRAIPWQPERLADE